MRPTRPTKPALRRLAVLAGALAALAALRCGGGGGGSGPTSPPPPTPGITFTPSSSAAAPGIALATGAGSSANLLVLEVRATGISNLYGIAFDLQVPGTVLSFTSSSNTGSILSNGTFQISHTATDLVFGASLLGGVAGVPGTGVIVTLMFQPATAGSGTFTFTHNAAFDSTGQPIAGVTWTAGTVQVVR